MQGPPVSAQISNPLGIAFQTWKEALQIGCIKRFCLQKSKNREQLKFIIKPVQGLFYKIDLCDRWALSKKRRSCAM